MPTLGQLNQLLTDHYKWLATPEGITHMEEVQKLHNQWQEEKEKECYAFATNLRIAKMTWKFQERRWARRFIQSNGKKSTTEAIGILLKIPGYLTWRSECCGSDLPNALRRILEN